MLTPEQAEEVKRKLVEQVEAAFPEDRKEFAKNQIVAMDSEQLEKFLIKNKLIATEGQGTGQCVFCSIIFGDIKSYKISENKKTLAVLEINPVSRGHTLIIPKEHLASEGELSKEAVSLSKTVASLMKKRLKPKEVRNEPANIMGHEIINLIPLYENEEIGERKSASPEELSELQELLRKKSPKKRAVRKKTGEGKKTFKQRVKEFEEKIWLPKRIP